MTWVLTFPLAATNANYELTFEGFKIQNFGGPFLRRPNQMIVCVNGRLRQMYICPCVPTCCDVPCTIFSQLYLKGLIRGPSTCSACKGHATVRFVTALAVPRARPLLQSNPQPTHSLSVSLSTFHCLSMLPSQPHCPCYPVNYVASVRGYWESICMGSPPSV